MTGIRLILRSLAFYWRTHLAVALASLVASAVLIGALGVGDCLQGNLRQRAMERLGGVHWAMIGGERTFGSHLADAARTAGFKAAAVLQQVGTACRIDGRAIGEVQVLGVDKHFGNLWSSSNSIAISDGKAFISMRLAKEGDLKEGDTIVLRVPRLSALPVEAPLAPRDALGAALRVTIAGIVPGADGGNFGLAADQVPPMNVIVSSNWLQSQLDLPDRANLMLAAPADAVGSDDADLDALAVSVDSAWRLSDAQLRLQQFGKWLELGSDRVFFTQASAPEVSGTAQFGLLTYMVNELRVGERSTPYSMVSALGSDGIRDLALMPELGNGWAELADDEILINEWLAEDLNAKPGHSIGMKYFIVADGGRIEERTAEFRIKAIIPLQGLASDRTLMPNFPGLADVGNCRDWQAGVPVDLSRVRQKDEQYWEEHRGTPKAFITLLAGQRLWGNRFGNLTAVRYAAQPGSLSKDILKLNSPRSIGLKLHAVRQQALQAAKGSTDFGILFVGFSLFLIVSCLMLMTMVHKLAMQQRGMEMGMLLALGIRQGHLRRLMLVESSVPVVAGIVVGVAAGLFYAKLMLLGMTTIWGGPLAGQVILFDVRWPSMLIGGGAAFAAAMAAIWLTLRRQFTQPAKVLLSGETAVGVYSRSRWQKLLTILCLVGVGVLVLFTELQHKYSHAAFFGMGTLVLTAFLLVCHSVLNTNHQSQRGKINFNLVRFITSGLSRNPGRSLAVIIILACGTFIISVVSLSRNRSIDYMSGTGGFSLLAKGTLPLLADLNTSEGLKAFGITSADVKGAGFVNVRVRRGDRADCLNLNRSRQPELLGINEVLLAQRNAFKFTSKFRGTEGWSVLSQPLEPDEVAAVGDHNTIVYSLGLKLGESLQYVDEQGRSFSVRIVGVLEDCVLQGSLIISERDFLSRFGSEPGYRLLLIDGSFRKVLADLGLVANKLSEAGADIGLTVRSATTRLDELREVENTYLSIFMLLGGLGLVLGSAGLGMVVLRNVHERRGELAVLEAVGYTRSRIALMILLEHTLLLMCGIAGGVLTGMVAAGPTVVKTLAWTSMAGLVAIVAMLFAFGLACTAAATCWALRGELVQALRKE